MKRATIYLDEDLHKALKYKSIETGTSISGIVNSTIRHSLEEDLEDLAVIRERSAEGTITYEAFLKELRNRGQL